MKKREVWMTKWPKGERFPLQVPLDLDWRELVFKLPNGTELSIEIFEREGGGVKIRTMDGTLLVVPEASNCVILRSETYEQASKRRREEQTS